MKIGYARVSTQDQNLDRQIDELKKAGCERIFEEKESGTKKERPELVKMMEQIRAGDIIIVSELARLSRSTKDLIDLSEKIDKNGAELISLKEKLDTTTATGKLMFGMLTVMAQFERDLISERTKQGLKSARARGRVGGRKPKQEKAIESALKLYYGEKHTMEEITELTKVSRSTLYRYISKLTPEEIGTYKSKI